MKPALSHAEAFAELDAVAFDLVDAAERDAIMLHVATCAVCRAELHALRETAADVALSAPPAPKNIAASRSRIRDRLVARAVAEREPVKPATMPLVFPVAKPAVGGAPRHHLSSGLAIAAGLLFVASLGMLGLSHRGRQHLADALKMQVNLTETTRRAADSLREQLAARDSLIAGIVGRDVTVMTLTSKSAKNPSARMFWDRTRHTWTMIAHNMPDLKNGRTYQLWLVTPKSKISAGTFTAHNGEAVVRATYNLTQPLRAIAVTNEPAGGVRQPTGAPIVAAEAR